MSDFRYIHEANHPPQELFNLVKDVSTYPLFLPWVSKSSVYNPHVPEPMCDAFYADMTVTAAPFPLTFSYTTLVSCFTLESSYKISMESETSPFQYMIGAWDFYHHEKIPNGCIVDFYLEYVLLPHWVNNVIGEFLKNMASHLVLAFIDEAQKRQNEQLQKTAQIIRA